MKVPLSTFSRYLSVALFLLPASLPRAEELDATLNWARRVELSTPVRGVVAEVLVQAGQRVEAGRVLLRLDQRAFQARVAEARARSKSTQAMVREAQRELERAEELYERTVLSDHDLQTAKNDAIQAQADYEAARAEQIRAEQELEYSAVTAPFNALVIRVNAEVGQTVINDLQPVTLAVVADADTMLAQALITDEQALALKPGDKVSVTVRDRQHAGEVHSISLEPEKDTDRYRLQVMFALDNQVYRVGQRARIEMP